MADDSSPAEVLKQFDRLRQDVLTVINEGRKIADGIPAIAAAAKMDFSSASDHVSQLHLSLAVVGAEGAGKSTLIRGLLKQELSPIEPNQPGTVAPVFLMYGEGSPRFTVEFSEPGKKPLQCDQKTCFEYIQQKSNEHNVKHVSRVVVEVDNPLLAHGLVLVDAPGTDGVSDDVRVATQEFIRRQAAAVVGVARDRSYGPLVKIARELSTPTAKITFQAIVSNRDTDYFVDDKGQMELLPDEEIAKKIKESLGEGLSSLKQAFVEYDLSDELTEDDLFVFSPNILHLLDDQQPKLATPAHRAEINRFLGKVGRYVRDNGLEYAILRAVAHAESVIAMRVRAYVELRKAILEGVLAGDQTLFKAFLDAAVAAYPIWQAVYNAESIAAIKEEAWQDLKKQLAIQRTSAVKKIDNLIRELRARSDEPPTQVIHDKVGLVRLDIAAQITAANESFAETVGKVHEKLIEPANQMLAAIFNKMPIVESGGNVDVEALSVDDTVRIGLEQDNSDLHRLFAKATGGVIGGSLGAKGAALLFFVPDPFFITQTIGLILGGAVAWKAVDKAIKHVYGGARAAAIKELTAIRNRLLNEEIEEYGVLHEKLSQAIDTIGKAIDAALDERIAQVRSLFSDPSPQREVIEADMAMLNDAQTQLGKLTERLSEIRTAARQ